MKTGPEIYTENLALFCEALRADNINIGIEETLDAARALEIVGMEKRATVRAALKAIFAKSERQQSIFDVAFDNFFVGLEQRRRKLEEQDVFELESAKQFEAARDELQYNGKPLDLDDSTIDAYCKLPAKTRTELMDYLNFLTDNKRHSPLNERYIANAICQRLSFDMLSGSKTVPAPTDTNNLLYKNISDITSDEIPHAISLIQTLVRQINGEVARRTRRSGKKANLDFRKTIHKSLRTGGMFYNLSYKRRQKSRRRIVMLCDVSGSMIQFSQFAIRFVKSMSSVAYKSESYIFSDGFSHISPFVLNHMNSFEQFVKESGLWGKGTDVSYALNRLSERRPAPLSLSTVLLIISDTKTISAPAAVASLKNAAAQVGEVLWLNPIPKELWPHMNTVSALSPHCRMLDCSTIHNLATSIRRLG